MTVRRNVVENNCEIKMDYDFSMRIPWENLKIRFLSGNGNISAFNETINIVITTLKAGNCSSAALKLVKRQK